MKYKKWLIRGLKAILIGLIILCWFIYLRKNWSNLSEYKWTVNWASVGLSMIFFLLGYLLLGSLWAAISFQITGQYMSSINAFRVSAMAWMGRYVPGGKIWVLASKVYLSVPDKKRIASIGTAATIETLLFEFSGLLLAMIIFPFFPNIKIIPHTAPIISGVLLSVGLLVIHPKIFCPVINRFLKMLRQTPIDHQPQYGVMLLIMLGYMFTFVLWGTAFSIFAHSVKPFVFADLPLLVAIFSISWVSGYFVLLAPAGLGVRESIMTMALQPFIPLQASIIFLVVGARMLTTISEMFCLLIALAVPHLGFKSLRPCNLKGKSESGVIL